MVRHPLLSLPPILAALVSLSCSTGVTREPYQAPVDGLYDSEFPSRRCSKQLEQISESVKMLTAIAYYRTFSFRSEERILRSSLTPDFLEAREKESVLINKSLSGTATIIWAEERRVALLTCAHIVAFPDTELAYHLGPDRHPTPYLKTYSVKERQLNFVGILPEGGALEILAMDKGADVAILGKQFDQAPSVPLSVFPYPAGRASELEWGAFLYLFGYPSGYRMVTKGIVSSPNRDRRGAFLTDAVIGGGFSGGIAVAIRDGVPNFELVGMVKMVSARTAYVLRPPHEDGQVEYDPTVPYTGEVFVERDTDIEYGVAQAVPIEAILEVLGANRSALEARGYMISLKKSAGK